MQKYIAKRILFLIPTIIGVTLIIYLIMNITPGDPGRAILGSGVSQADVDAYNHAIGYDLPFFQKFVNYLSNMFLHQDFGISYVTKQNVFDEIWPRYIMTLKLAVHWNDSLNSHRNSSGNLCCCEAIFTHGYDFLSYLLPVGCCTDLCSRPCTTVLLCTQAQVAAVLRHSELDRLYHASTGNLTSHCRTEFPLYQVVYVRCDSSGLCPNCTR